MQRACGTEMFLKTPQSIAPVTSTTGYDFICGGEGGSGDAASTRNARPSFSPSAPSSSSITAVEGGHGRNGQASIFNSALPTENPTEQQPQPCQLYSGSDSADNSATSLWCVPSRVASPCEMPASAFAEGNTSILASPSVPGVVWIGYVTPSRVRELSPLLNSLKGIRSTSADTANGTTQRSLDFTFFLDGPCEGQGFLCFYTPREAEEAVRMFPSMVMVGQQKPFMQFSMRLSSVEELAAAKQQYHYDAMRPTFVAAQAQPVVQNLVYWLRGLPFQTQRADVENFLKGIRYVRLDIGVLESGECSGNAFVELNGTDGQLQVENLHNTFIPCAAHAAVPPLDRPKPRFVEVILSNANRRLEQLSIDRSMVRNHLPHYPRIRVPATKVVSSLSPATAAAVTRYADDRTASPHQGQPHVAHCNSQDYHQPSLQPHCMLTAASSPQQVAATTFSMLPAPQAASSYYLVQNVSQVVGLLPTTATTTPSNSCVTSPSQLISPAEVLSMMGAEPRLPRSTVPLASTVPTYSMAYEPVMHSSPLPPATSMLPPSARMQTLPVCPQMPYGSTYYALPSHRP